MAVYKHKPKYKTVKVKTLTICILATVLFIQCFVWWSGRDVLDLGVNDEEWENLVPFENELFHDFPTSGHVTPRIPHIIHQTWKDVNIPDAFHDNIRSFSDHNPDFEYYFWTDKSARALIQAKQPQLLELFDNIVEPVRRADLLRYLFLLPPFNQCYIYELNLTNNYCFNINDLRQ